MIYAVMVTKAGEVIFSHDIVLEKDRDFQEDVNTAMNTFRRNSGTSACSTTMLSL